MKTDCGTNQVKNFYGKTLLNHSMCLLPSLPITATIKLSKARGCIVFVDCNLIIVCGIYTKTICNNGQDIISEEIPYKVLIEDSGITDLDKDHYIVECIEVKEICSKFTCLNTKTNTYYKLKETDLVTVRVSYNQCTSISWTQTVKLFQ